MGNTYRNLLNKVPVFDSMPEGWQEIKDATTAPNGYVWIWNKKFIFSKESKTALLKLSPR